MILSRVWYVILSIVTAGALYVVFLAVGQYDRRNTVAMNEELASDSQIVGWALQIDARHRLDALLVGAVDKGVQDALSSADGKDRIPQSSKDGARKALAAVADKLPADFKEDALFAVDRDGRVVAQVGYDAANAFDDMELGGYAAVFDALHGFLRDDTWVLGGKMYRVVARPVEFDVTQPPAGAIVGLKGIDNAFAQDLAKRTRVNVAFYANGQRVSFAQQPDFEPSAMDQVGAKLAQLGADKGYTDTGHSDVYPLSDTTGALFARLYGEAWDLGAGYAVARAHAIVGSPMGFVSGADDKDKANVNWLLLAIALLGGAAVGIAFTVLEYTLPLREVARQAAEMKRGGIDFFQLPRLGRAYRGIAQDVNGGIERVGEKGGGATRRPADLEQIIGPVPAQPAMSAFALPGQVADNGARTTGSVPGASMPRPPSGPGSGPLFPQPGQSAPQMGGLGAPPPAPPGGIPTPMAPPQMPVGAGGPPPRPQPAVPGATSKLAATGGRPAAVLPGGPPPPPPPPHPPGDESEDEEATMVAAIPAEVLAAATGEHRATEDTQEWLSVYEDFIRTKKQCGEPTDGLTFEKFQHTLKKNRDALMQRHGCKRVRFSVYVKEGRASLKATPVKE
jgi:hypothetical protein